MASFPDEYKILKRLGDGSHASAFKVRHKQLGYIRALKVLNSFIVDETDRPYQSFLKECSLLLRIGNGCHPNIVRLYQPRLLDNKATVEMDYIDGETLSKYIERQQGFIRFEEICKFIREIVDAVAFIHHDIYRFQMSADEDDLEVSPDDASKYIITPEKERELVKKYSVMHNDLHSENIMRRDYDGAFVLLDFGLAIQNDTAVKSSSITDGAIEYRSPEKWLGRPLTKASDVYSLGVILYELLTGRVPFPATGPEMDGLPIEKRVELVSRAHINGKVPSIWDLRAEAFENKYPDEVYVADYIPDLERIVMKALAKNPAERYPDVRAMLDDINKVLPAVDSIDKTVADHVEVQQLKDQIGNLSVENNNLKNENNDLTHRLAEAQEHLRSYQLGHLDLNKPSDRNASPSGGKSNSSLAYIGFLISLFAIIVLESSLISGDNFKIYDDNASMMHIISIVLAVGALALDVTVAMKKRMLSSIYMSLSFLQIGLILSLAILSGTFTAASVLIPTILAIFGFIILCQQKSRA